MTTRISAGAAVAALLILSAATAAFAHEAHKKRAEEAAGEASRPETSTPALPSTVSVEEAVKRGPPETGLPRPLAWLGKFHPALTHFPIALLISALVAELLFMRTGSPLFEHAVRFSVWFGAAGALAAATLGWFFAGFHLIDDEWVMTAHRWTGTTTALCAGGLFYLVERVGSGATPRSRFRAALFSGAALVGATGFFGGALIYGLDHYAWQECR